MLVKIIHNLICKTVHNFYRLVDKGTVTLLNSVQFLYLLVILLHLMLKIIGIYMMLVSIDFNLIKKDIRKIKRIFKKN